MKILLYLGMFYIIASLVQCGPHNFVQHDNDHTEWCLYRHLFIIFRIPIVDWAKDLALPTRFSTPTNKAIQTGVLTKSARVEIVHSVATLMLMHTSRPTPHDLDTISRRLVEKHPKLRDTVDKGYVSVS